MLLPVVMSPVYTYTRYELSGKVGTCSNRNIWFYTWVRWWYL